MTDSHQPNTDKQEYISVSMRYAMDSHNLDLLKELAETHHLNMHPELGHELLVRAASLGDGALVDALIPYTDATLEHSRALFNTVVAGRADTNAAYLTCIKLLLPVSDLSEWTEDMWAACAPEALTIIEQYHLNQQLSPSSKLEKSIPRL